MKHIILCADDYGQNSTISQAIVNLIERGRLSATSCMVNSPEWPRCSDYLQPHKAKIQIGLHFNLSHGTPLSFEFIKKYGMKFPGLGKLLARSCLRMVDQKCIAAELEAQIEMFKRYLGKLPDFIDGHQHIHQFPLIRDAVIDVWDKRLKSQNAYIRYSFQGKGGFQLRKGWLKRWIVKKSGAKAFKKLLVTFNIPHNSSFSGMYDFSAHAEYAKLFPLFLQQVNDGGIIMCHPGLASADESDPIAYTRFSEYRYFMSDQFILDCQAYEARLK